MAKGKSEKHKNPALYRELSEPFETYEEAAKSATEFFNEVGEIRKKHRIPDVVIVYTLRYKDEAGEEVVAGSRFSYGDSMMELPMLAQALGSAKSEFDAMYSKLASKS